MQKVHEPARGKHLKAHAGDPGRGRSKPGDRAAQARALSRSGATWRGRRVRLAPFPPPSVSDPSDSRAHQIHGFFASRAVRTHSRSAEGEARNARTTFHTM